jgi:hypothetical protein
VDSNDPRPAKKARRDERRPAPVTTSTKYPLHSQDSPDPLNTISSPDHHSSRTRQGANTFSAAPTFSPPSSRWSMRHAGHQSRPVVIANDVNASIVELNPDGQVHHHNAAHNSAVIAETEAAAQVGQRQNAFVPEKRSLRSHDGGSRSKSELAMYFPSYEQMISLQPVKTGEFILDTRKFFSNSVQNFCLQTLR